MISSPHSSSQAPSSNNDEIRNTKHDSQSPQASASTNSAIRATVEESHKVPASSSRVEFPAPEIVMPSQNDKVGNQMARPAVGPYNSTHVGASRELRVAVDLMDRGYQVFRNMAPSGIDLVAWGDGRFIKVEVVTGIHRADGSISWGAKPPHYEYDLIAAVLLDGTIEYFEGDR